ncbi:MAG: cation diffusion facilitator family transporter [Elusimicrobia bacterium]|nr:cation diffusion facilitator family transporter [Elusimicrobiota bacterium]
MPPRLGRFFETAAGALTTMTIDKTQADREKRAVALTSVLAAVALTVAKLVVGLSTNSIGILSEAAHSGLDLIAAGVTLWAVTAASKPADREHAYGHGKIENLSALFETVLLLATCAWISWEAVERLFFREAAVVANAWSFGVVLLSIAVDYSRSRALMAAAKKHRSQALEADALHFSTDIWSSAVVLLGLFGVLASRKFAAPWLVKADAAAALGVAAIVVGVCWKLGSKAVDDLLDTASPDLQEKVRRAAAEPGVTDVRQVRVRRSGPSVFVDVTVGVDRDCGIERAHAIADGVEAAVQAAVPEADVLVHAEPSSDASDPITVARALASRRGLAAHSIRICDDRDGRTIELHLEVRPGSLLSEAHDLASAFESDLRRALPGIKDVVSHLEPGGGCPCPVTHDPAGESRVQKALLSFQGLEKTAFHAHEVTVRTSAGQMSLSLHCSLDGATSIREAHSLTVRLEKHLRAAVPQLGRVIIHSEPSGSQTP